THEAVADGQLTVYHVDHVVQVAAMPHVVDQRLIATSHGVPVRTVRVRVVEEVALIAPRLFEDLLPLDGRIDVRGQRHGEPAAAAATTAAGCTPARSIDDLPAAAALVKQLPAVVRCRYTTDA